MRMTFWHSGTMQQYNAVSYPTQVTVENIEQLLGLAQYDHMAGKCSNNYRADANFQWADTIIMDCDNTHSDSPEDWTHMEDMADISEALCLSCGVVPSKSNMVSKGGKEPRPKLHLYFPLKNAITDGAQYRALKYGILLRFKDYGIELDPGAVNIAQLIAGRPKLMPNEVLWLEDERCIDEIVEPVAELPKEEQTTKGNQIAQGDRNRSMYSFALKGLIRFGKDKVDNVKASFDEHAALCDPPLPAKELLTVWRSAVQHAKRKWAAPDYVPAEEYFNKQYMDGFFEPAKPAKESAPVKDEAGFFEYQPFPEEAAKQLPDFPVSALPDVLKNMAETTARMKRAPIDFCAVAELAAVSLAISKKYAVQSNSQWIESVNLYTMTVGNPSEHKTPAMNPIIEPIEEYCRQENERRAAAVQTWQDSMDMLEFEREQIKKGKDKKITHEEKRVQLMEINAQIEELKRNRVRPINLLSDNITPEALQTKLYENNGKGGIFSDEGGLIDIMAGMYSGGVANIDIFTEGYTGAKDKMITRRNREEIIPKPTITMYLTVQRSVLQQMMSNEAFTGKGLNARFLFAIPKSLVGTRTGILSDADDNPFDRQDYADLIFKLMSVSDDCTRMLMLSPEASSLFTAFHDELEHRQIEDLDPIQAWTEKLNGNTLRIAGVLHCATVADVQHELTISADTMRNAIIIARYFIEHYIAACNLSGLYEDQTAKRCKYIFQKLQTWDAAAGDMSTRKLHQRVRGDHRFKNIEDLRSVLTELTNRGYIKIVAAKKADSSGSKRGRPSETIVINPKTAEATEPDEY